MEPVILEIDWNLVPLVCLGLFDFVGDIFTGFLGYKGQEHTNEANAEQAALNRQFQERMSSTSYQRATADMQSAGLNPMLAYQQGGASSPGGSTAVMGNKLGAGLSSAMEFARTKAEIKRTFAETDRTHAEAERIRADIPGVQAESARLQKELVELVPVRIRTAQFEQDVKDAAAYFAQFEKNVPMSSRENQDLVYKYFQGKFKSVPVEVRERMARTVLHNLEAKYFVPIQGVRALGTLAGSAASVRRSLGRFGH